MPTIAAAHDLCGVGRCSLTTALAVLPAMGHHCCPLPTAVLSQQTALPGYSFLDTTSELPAYLEGWVGLGIRPDFIYTGFLGNGRQADRIADWAARFDRARVLVDPVMGDDGALYDCYDMGFVAEMRHLARIAHVLTPNATELLLLAGRPASSAFPSEDSEVLALAAELHAPRLELLVVTSVHQDGEGVHREGQLCNLLVEPAQGRVERLPCRSDGVSYSGSGDLFASLLCGQMAWGIGHREAVAFAAAFITDAVAATPAGSDPRFGLHYEPLLHRLTALGQTMSEGVNRPCAANRSNT